MKDCATTNSSTQGTLKIHDKQDADGKQVGNIIGTGRTQREAIKLAEDWQKNHQLKGGEQIYVLPHTFNFGMDENYTPVMGDKDFAVMMSRISQNTGLPLDEAKQIVKGAVKLKNRHRFLGQLLHRKGYAGYEKDMDWVLRHHLNTVARYVALETEFKPKAISLFERVFGAFDKDHSKNLLAQYTKDYINDVNGNPAWIDEAINKTLNQNSVWRKFFLPNVGERGGQRIANTVAARIAYLKLDMGNISSALINFTQLINAAATTKIAAALPICPCSSNSKSSRTFCRTTARPPSSKRRSSGFRITVRHSGKNIVVPIFTTSPMNSAPSLRLRAPFRILALQPHQSQLFSTFVALKSMPCCGD